jgi:hypothetical protein
VNDAAGSATAAAEFIIGIVACAMVGRHGPHRFVAERLQHHHHHINNDNNNNNDQC